MKELLCPRCHGTGEEKYDNLSGIDGDTSYDYIKCRACDGSGKVPEVWAEAWDEHGFEGRCDICRRRRPVVIVEGEQDRVMFVCASCAGVAVR